MNLKRGNWKLLRDGANTMLFDLSADPGERNNLAAERSDIAHRLWPLLAAWEKDVDDEARRSTPPLPAH